MGTSKYVTSSSFPFFFIEKNNKTKILNLSHPNFPVYVVGSRTRRWPVDGNVGVLDFLLVSPTEAFPQRELTKGLADNKLDKLSNIVDEKWLTATILAVCLRSLHK